MEPRLYKFVRARYAEEIVRHGRLLFRNLSYFRTCEQEARGDPLEGRKLEIRNGERPPERDVAIVEGVESDSVFAFCVSRRFDAALFAAFDADACVEILSPREFLVDCRQAIERHELVRRWQFLHGCVEYYDPEAPDLRATDPERIPFCKPSHFADQDEFRLVIAEPASLRRNECIVDPERVPEVVEPERERPRALELQLPGDAARRRYMRIR